MANLIVHLRGFKAKSNLRQLAYDANGGIQNENNICKLHYGKKEWKNFLSQIGTQGYVDVRVEAVFEESERVGTKLPTYSKVDIPDEIAKEVRDAFHGVDVEKELTPDQKRIAELESALAEIRESQRGAVKAEEPKKRVRRTKEQIEQDESK